MNQAVRFSELPDVAEHCIFQEIVIAENFDYPRLKMYRRHPIFIRQKKVKFNYRIEVRQLTAHDMSESPFKIDFEM